MSEESELSPKREELKHQLAAGEYKTLLDVMFDRTGRFIQKLTRRKTPPSFLYSALLLALIILLINFLISILFGEFYSPVRRELIPLQIATLVMLLSIWVGLKIYFDSFFINLRNYLLDAIVSEADLTDFQRWLTTFGNLKNALLLGLVLGILFGLDSTIKTSTRLGGFVGFGQTIFSILIMFSGVGIFVYYFFLFFALPIRLSRYHFKLYAADPSSSETIDRISDMLSNFVYLWTALVSVAILLLAILLPWHNVWRSVLPLVMSMILLILLFILNQYALSKIITRAKWNTLNGIQIQVETLQAQESILGEETLDHIDKLMDYHDRIKATRNSALDFRAGLSFLNSLLIPVFVFVLANLDNVLSLFNR